MLPPSRDPSAGRAFREYGFVHFSERAYALKAVEAAEAEKPRLDGAELQVGGWGDLVKWQRGVYLEHVGADGVVGCGWT